MLKQYVDFTATTRASLESKKLDNLHMILGLVTEVGELADVFKKQMAYGKDIDWVNISEELGDIIWYWAGLCDINELDCEDILRINMKKLKARYPDKFTNEKAINRDLKTERSILENPL